MLYERPLTQPTRCATSMVIVLGRVAGSLTSRCRERSAAEIVVTGHCPQRLADAVARQVVEVMLNDVRVVPIERLVLRELAVDYLMRAGPVTEVGIPPGAVAADRRGRMMERVDKIAI